jgi:hypothetical protein
LEAQVLKEVLEVRVLLDQQVLKEQQVQPVLKELKEYREL